MDTDTKYQCPLFLFKIANIQKSLNHCIITLNNSHSLFVENLNTEFILNCKLNFSTIINHIICMETDSLKDKLLKLNDYSIDTLTALACIQARNKIKINVFKFLFDNFIKKTNL